MKTVFEVSSGGVVYRKVGDDVEFVLIRVGNRYCLPKGHVEKNEKIEETAVREVEEETGLRVRLVGFLDKIQYWFYSKGEDGKTKRHKKEVYFFLMEEVGGSSENHSWEVDEVLHLPYKTALEIITFPTEKNLLKKAYERLINPYSRSC